MRSEEEIQKIKDFILEAELQEILKGCFRIMDDVTELNIHDAFDINNKTITLFDEITHKWEIKIEFSDIEFEFFKLKST